MKETLPNPYDDQQTLPPRLRAQNGRISTPANYMYSKLLLFSSVEREKDLHESDLREKFLRRDASGDVIVVRNER